MDNKIVIEQFSQLSQYQREKLTRIILDYMKQNELEQEVIVPEICPTCGKVHAHIIKAGKQNGKQRFRCLDCGHTFVYTKGKLNYWSHQGNDVWNNVIIDTLNGTPLCLTSADINITIPNVFYMRHKILIFLEQLVITESTLLSGVVEYDETYVNDAYKGRFQNGIPTGRTPRRHGGTAAKRGLSREKICILTASDRKGSEIIKAVGRAKPTTNAVISTYANKVQINSVCVNDGVYSYDKLITECCLENRVVSDKNSYTPVYHLNTVNSMHREWKELWHLYKGVSTKYLNRYLSLFSFMRQYMGMDSQEQFHDIYRKLKNLILIIPVRIVKHYNLLTI